MLSNNDKNIQKFGLKVVTVSEPYTLGEVDKESKKKFIHNYY